MLLPLDCLAYQIVEDRVLPTWLGEPDEPFVARVVDAIAGLAGLSNGEADLVLPGNLARVAREARLPVRIAHALWAIERKRWEATIDAPVDPEVLRDALFELSARLPREEALAEAAQRLGITSEVVTGSLFADRPCRRVLTAPAQRARASDLVARYNLAFAQTLFARSMEVEASIVGDPAPIAVAAKRDGLLARFEVAPDVTRLTLAGPLSVFHDTVKYGRSIARFVPALVAAPTWSLRARVTLGSRSAELYLENGGAIAFARTIPAAPDGRLARRVARALRSAGVRVDLHPEVVRSGGTLVVPDFALDWSSGRVLVDIVPFATPEYLACKRDAIAALDVPMLVCVDERFMSKDETWLVPYRREVDAWTLYAAAKRLLDRSSSSGPRPSPPGSGCDHSTVWNAG